MTSVHGYGHLRCCSCCSCRKAVLATNMPVEVRRASNATLGPYMSYKLISDYGTNYDVCGTLFLLDISGPEDQICLDEKVYHKRHKLSHGPSFHINDLRLLQLRVQIRTLNINHHLINLSSERRGRAEQEDTLRRHQEGRARLLH